MKNPNFVDPATFPGASKQEMFTMLKKEFNPESLAWLDSITKETVFNPAEFEIFESLIRGYCNLSLDSFASEEKFSICKPMLLFDESFLPDITDNMYYSKGIKEVFRTDLFNEERIKNLPLLFTKIDNKETFYPWVGKIIGAIKLFCTKNEEFAQEYQAKLAEIRSGSLRERLFLYADMDDNPHDMNKNLISELEQPVLEMLREYFNDNDHQYLTMVDLLFASLLQTQDRIQIPCWNEENHFCRLLLDYGIINRSIGIVDALFRNHTVSETFQIICAHINRRKIDMLQFPEGSDRNCSAFNLGSHLQKREIHRREFIKYLENHIPELFSFDVPDQYFVSLHGYFNCFFDKTQNDSSFDFYEFENDSPTIDYMATDFLCKYLTDKLESAINGNDLKCIHDIYRLFEEENKDWFKGITLGKKKKKRMEELKSLNSHAIEILDSGEATARLREKMSILKDYEDYSKYLFNYTCLFQLLFVMKGKGDKRCPSLEDLILKYIPLDMFDKVLSFPPFQEQNEDMYQNMIQTYPGLSRRDALLERLLPCFVTIAMRDLKEISAIVKLQDHPYLRMLEGYEKDSFYPWEQFFLCILNKLCEMRETDSESITLIFEILSKIFEMLSVHVYRNRAALDIVVKYQHVQEPLLEYCNKIIHSSSLSPRVSAAACIIGTYKGVWKGLKQLLIVIRTLKREWVHANLGLNWDPCPDDKVNLFREIEVVYLAFFSESLKKLRQEMANGLSDWLKPLPNSKRGDLNKRLENYPSEEKEMEGFDISYTEPNPIWRYAYVRAIADLGVDVDGKGHYIHSIMDKVAKEDPSEMVREAAARTTAECKNLRDGWDGDTHYRKIELALWWFRQASRLAMNLPVDKMGALYMRNSAGFQNMAPTTERSFNDEKIQAREKLMRARFEI
jgi:hypothetical protein